MKKETPHGGGASAFIGDLDNCDNTETFRENQASRTAPIAVIRKNASENIHVERSEFKGYDLVSIRVFAKKESGDFVPTAKGVTFRRELLPEIIVALQCVQGGGE